MQLRIPGPTPCPEKVLRAVGQQMINHRSQEFAQLISGITNNLKEFFLTRNDVFLLSASGTGGVEAAIVNTLSPGDRVLAITNGAFGERFAQIAQTYGAEVTRLDFPWGEPADPDKLRGALKDNPHVKAVLIVHNETSTGLTNPLLELSLVVREFGKLLVVDGVSSLGSLELRVDDWGIDVAVTGSQKGWMAPPGLAMLSFSPNAWQAYGEAKMPRYYLDVGRARTYLERGQTPWTPSLSTVYGLAAGLELMKEEGLSNIWQRHIRVGKAAREGVKSLGFALFPREAFASNTVTAVNSDGVDVKKFLQLLRDELGTVLAGGQGKLEGKIFRIGHLGLVTEEDIREVIKHIEIVMPRAGLAHA